VSDRTAGSIYNLGYRRYDGLRLGRAYAVRVLWLHRLRACFGIGRPWSSKVFPMALVGISLLPAIVQLGIGALGGEDAEIIKPQNYYRFVQVILALFAAAVAPELASRDQRSGTLTLYFSRALERTDYALANFAALTTSMLALTLLPQLLLFTGNGLVVSDPATYLQDEWKQMPEIVGSALLLSAMLAGIGLAAAAFTPRRAYSTVAILAVFLLGSAVGATLISTSNGDDAWRYGAMISPFHIIAGFSFWFFGASPNPGSDMATADIPGAVYALEALAIAVAGLAVFVWRCLGMRA
jgi:ABC-2 type transport system permease protein